MVDRVVFDVELVQAEAFAEARGAHERREARVESGARLAGNREQLTIAPQIFRTAFDLFAGDPDGAVVVVRLERAQALLADPQSFSRKRRFTEMTLQTLQRACAHTAPSQRSPR